MHINTHIQAWIYSGKHGYSQSQGTGSLLGPAQFLSSPQGLCLPPLTYSDAASETAEVKIGQGSTL